jgi:hypothetical protein
VSDAEDDYFSSTWSWDGYKGSTSQRLHQGKFWFSTSHGRWMPIAKMDERHKRNAFGVLKRKGYGDSPLAKALAGTDTKLHSAMEEYKMTSKAELIRSQALRSIERAEEALRKADALEEAYANEPTAPEGECAVIQWQENFGRDNGPAYTYAAIRINDRWYVTAKTFKSNESGLPWDEMVQRYYGLRHGDFWVATEWIHTEV